jgi:hypothetical protein
MKDSKIFLLAGKARSGKDTVAKIISEYYKGKKIVQIGFADYIKGYCQKITGWDGTDETKPREVMQHVGSDIVRDKINKDFFINRVCEDIEVYKYFFDVIIISGARFPNELEIPKQKFSNVFVIKMERPNYENELTIKQKAHITENALDDYKNYDYVIENNGDIQELKEKVKEMLRSVEDEY